VPLELASGLVSTEADRLLQAEALVRSYCRWHIAPARTETLTLPAGEGVALLLPSLMVTAVASVTVDGTALTADEYTWTEAGVLKHSTNIRWGSGTVVVEFTHGYAEAPPDVTAIVQSVAQRAVDNPGSLVRKQVGPFGDTYSQTGFNQSLPLALLDAEKDVLAAYRLAPRP
jgi:hypothetical protein